MQQPSNFDYYDYQNYERPRPRLIDKLGGNKPFIHILLFILTIISTWMVQGIWYAIAIITILLAHEMGHYLMCRKYRIPATLPFFIPFPFPPLNPFGTMGAVIKMEGRLPDRKALFDVGAAGPLAGLIFTIPALIIGLKLSQVIDASEIGPQQIYLGESFLFAQLSKLIIGELPEKSDVAPFGIRVGCCLSFSCSGSVIATRRQSMTSPRWTKNEKSWDTLFSSSF